MNPNDEGIRAIDRDEHNADAHAKRVVIRAQDPVSGAFVNVGATDNGDGSYSLKTAAAAGGTQFAEDVAHTTGAIGTLALGVRNSAMSTMTDADGDYSALVTDSAGRQNVSGQIAHDVGVNGNPVVVGAVASAAAPTDVSADQDAVRIWALRNGSQVVNIAGAGSLVAAVNNADADSSRIGLVSDARNRVYNGAAWDRMRGDATDGLLVNLGSNNDVSLNAGTNNIGDVDIETFENSADVTMQNAATATGNGTVLTTTGYGTAVIQVTGTFVGTITFEGSVDGTNYVSVSATQIGAGTIATTATATGIYRLSVAGLVNIRARISAYTSGSITAVGRATNAPYGTKAVAVSGSVTVGATTMPTTLLSFVTTVTTAGTRVQLATNTVTSGILIQAPSTNTGNIYVGGATVSSTVFGSELQPGQSTAVAIDNTNKLYIDASVSGDKLMTLGS